MDWFETLTGFRETNYDDTRAKLKVEGSRLQSLVNGKSYGIGELELVPLQTLRERVKSAGGLPGRLKVSVVTGDVRQMHRSPENAGALFQVASQFNLLEMVSPTVTPEHGVTRYQHDRTQGPACAIAAGAATIYRNYFAPVGGSHGQTTERQLDGLADLGESSGGRLESAGQGLMENAKRLRAMHPRRARRHCGTSRCAATGTARYPARQTAHRNSPRRGSHRCRRGASAAGLAGLLLGSPGGLHVRAARPLETFRVAGFGSSVRSHDVGRRAERTTRRIERRSAHTAWRGCFWQSTKAGFMPPCGEPLEMMSGFDLDVRLVSYGAPSQALLQMAKDFN